MAESGEIWVLAENLHMLGELIAGGKAVGEHFQATVTALVIGTRDEAGQAIACGADKVLCLGERDPRGILEDFVPTIVHEAETQKPSVLLIESTKRGRVIAGRVAAHFDVTVMTDVKQVLFTDDHLQARHLVFGGGAIRVDQPMSQMKILTVGAGVFSPVTPAEGRRGEIKEAAHIPPPWNVEVVERKKLPPVSVNLAKAHKVVCAGRGIARQQDLSMITQLAQLLGAEVGCSRPLAEGLDWLPRERYIGVSGATIKPDLYLGVGVSGQVQHTVGMNESRIVVAINRDPQAPIFSHCDYGIVGDLYVVVPALMNALKPKT